MKRLILCLGLVLAMGCAAMGQSKKVLIYTKNGQGYVHANIPASIECLKKICEANGWQYEATDDPAVFTAEHIATFDVLVFSNTNNETFDTDAQRDVFKDYIHNGGGFVGIHSACGSERDWPWFWANLGGKFRWHPHQQDFDIKVFDPTNPSTDFLGDVWKWKMDECYFIDHLNPDIHILLAVDLKTMEFNDREKPRMETYPNTTFGDYFPLAWCHQFEGGRQWYTALGHRDEHYQDEAFIRHLTGGINWAMGEKDKAEKTETNQ